MIAQEFNRRIRIQRMTGGLDSWGQPVETWETFATVWAAVRTQTGMGFINNEFQAGGGEVSRATVSFRIHKRDNVTAGMRVLYQGEPYDIRAVLPDLKDNRYLDLGCAKGANDG